MKEQREDSMESGRQDGDDETEEKKKTNETVER